MSIFGLFRKPALKPSNEVKQLSRTAAVQGVQRLPTVEFDKRLVTRKIRVNLLQDLEAIPEFRAANRGRLYRAALTAVERGGDLGHLCTAIFAEDIDGMTKGRGTEIARLLTKRARSTIEADRQLSLGITEAIWRYSGAPCISKAQTSGANDDPQDAAHRAADGLSYQVAEGMFLNGGWTWPGREVACKCFSRPVIPSLSKANS